MQDTWSRRVVRTLVVTACLAVTPSAGAQVQPSRPDDLADVQASSSLSAGCGAFTAMYAFDRRVVGSTVAPFTIPPGRVVVVTGFDWQVVGVLVDRTRTAVLYRVSPAGGLNGPSALSTATADGTGRAGGSITVPSGLVVEPGMTLCVRVSQPNAAEQVSGVVHGFFADR